MALNLLIRFCCNSFSSKAIYVPADDLTDPAPATTFAHLDATTVLSRAIAELGIYPAVDPLDSTSRIMDPNIVGQEHYDVARGVQKILQVREGRWCAKLELTGIKNVFWPYLVNTFCSVSRAEGLPPVGSHTDASCCPRGNI